tara:strand:- start:261 stop:596 length:336 start_codon:yes stop_codon:yes gene_type:complete
MKLNTGLEGQIHSIIGSLEPRDFRQIQKLWMLKHKELIESKKIHYNMATARILFDRDYRGFLRGFSGYLQKLFPDYIDRELALKDLNSCVTTHIKEIAIHFAQYSEKKIQK